MTRQYYQNGDVTLFTGDAATVVATLEPQSIQTVVTSPPYYGLRDYGVDGQLGAEETPSEFVSNLVGVFEAIRPVLRDDGTLWVNLGDSYASGSSNNGGYSAKSGLRGGHLYPNEKGRAANDATVPRRIDTDRPAKNLLGIPWRFAFAMQDAGWILRNDIIWAKPNGMPESVKDRLGNKHEHVFLFSKKPRYFFDLDPIRQPVSEVSVARAKRGFGSTHPSAGSGLRGQAMGSRVVDADRGKNPGDWWEITTKPFRGAHFATFPPELPERCVLAGSRPGDTVLDPFSGSGTTGMVAIKHGRKYVDIDLNSDYHDLALKTRLAPEKA